MLRNGGALGSQMSQKEFGNTWVVKTCPYRVVTCRGTVHKGDVTLRPKHWWSTCMRANQPRNGIMDGHLDWRLSPWMFWMARTFTIRPLGHMSGNWQGLEKSLQSLVGHLVGLWVECWKNSLDHQDLGDVMGMIPEAWPHMEHVLFLMLVRATRIKGSLLDLCMSSRHRINWNWPC